jgi:CPA2 family monovalent cation:H+ antiporter-2
MSLSGGTERLIELVFAALGRERELPVAGLAHDEARTLVAA